LTLGRSLDEDHAQRFKILLQRADGWTRRDHLVGRADTATATPEKTRHPFRAATDHMQLLGLQE
jgi:hypothetical protein